MKFCPQCGSLLLIEEGSTLEKVGDGDGGMEVVSDDDHAEKVEVAIMQFRCQLCPYIHEIREAYTSVLRTKKKEVEDVFGGDEAWENVDRTEAICPSCSHNEAFFKQIQIRSADEPMSTFYRCTKCHAKWNDR